VLDSLVRYRHLHSALLGYRSYAHRVLSDRMVGTPARVRDFLDCMEARSRRAYRRDMEALLEAKRRAEGTPGAGLAPWDVPYYTALIRALRQHQRWQEDGEMGGDEDRDESSQFAGYFTMENSIAGMKVLVRELFGIMMKEVDIPLEERWDVDTVSSRKTLTGDGCGSLRKFIFHHEEDGPLGTMYFDLYPREGKFVNAAHFTIRCGRTRNENDGDVKNNNHHQLPVVALVCNLSPASAPNATASDRQLSHSEVETLYHEFGHGLHSLLSRTSFQHLSGTRAAMDFVETPSHLFETVARDPGFLARVLAPRRARHLAMSHADLRAVEVQTQIVHSRFDQALFGEEPCCPALGGVSSTTAWKRLHREAGVPCEGHWHSQFGHLVTYGAGYYGYLYAQTFAADIWQSTLASSMASSEAVKVRERGMKIWKDMLVHGGAKDPMDMIRDVLGREPTVEPFFKGIP